VVLDQILFQNIFFKQLKKLTMKKLQNSHKWGLGVVIVLLLLNLVTTLATFSFLPTQLKGIGCPDEPTLWQHLGIILALSALTGALFGHVSQFHFSLEDKSFEASDKQTSYENSFIGFFVTASILLFVNLNILGDASFRIAMILTIFLDGFLIVVTFLLPPAFGASIDKGGTDGDKLKKHTSKEPPAHKEDEKEEDDKDTSKKKKKGEGVPWWVKVLIGFGILIILSRMFTPAPTQGNGTPNQSGKTVPNVVIAPQPATQQPNQVQQLTGGTNQQQQTGPHSPLLGR
jgi:hypothetical protein